jgi:hypothetical protein
MIKKNLFFILLGLALLNSSAIASEDTNLNSLLEKNSNTNTSVSKKQFILNNSITKLKEIAISNFDIQIDNLTQMRKCYYEANTIIDLKECIEFSKKLQKDMKNNSFKRTKSLSKVNEFLKNKTLDDLK